MSSICIWLPIRAQKVIHSISFHQRSLAYHKKMTSKPLQYLLIEHFGIGEEIIHLAAYYQN